VGESDEMTEKLFRFLPKAVAFIYVIDSRNAGGIQEDRVGLLCCNLNWYLLGNNPAFARDIHKNINNLKTQSSC